MASTSPRLLGALALAVLLAAACSGAPEPTTEVGGQQTTAPSPSSTAASTPDVVVPATPNTPDLSGVVIDCAAVEGPCEPGDDPDLDVLWDACADGDGRACDRLYYDAGFDTRYEQFGNTCGDRDVLVPCPEVLS